MSSHPLKLQFANVFASTETAIFNGLTGRLAVCFSEERKVTKQLKQAKTLIQEDVGCQRTKMLKLLLSANTVSVQLTISQVCHTYEHIKRTATWLVHHNLGAGK